jgi:glycosyltransferase involved in cell wall biosynthesis
MILSIIVPIYNASKYLHRCIDSLLAQGLKEGEYEIILINDGSKDQSLQICQEYQQTHPSIFKVLSHENQGVAYTRNRGIDEAKGDYICFVDADDYLKPNGYRYLIDTYLEENIDILMFWALTLDKKTKANYIENNDIEGKICYEIKGREFLQKGVQTFVWSSLYRRNLLIKEQIKFSYLTIGEDILFNLHVYMKNPLIRSISSRIYMYDLHEESTIHQRNYTAIRKAIQSYLILFQSIKEYIKSNQSDIKLCKGLQNSMESQFVPFMSRVLSSNYSIAEFKELKETLIKKDILPLKNKTKISNIINFIFRFPTLIKCNEFIYQNIFLTYIFPHLSRN